MDMLTQAEFVGKKKPSFLKRFLVVLLVTAILLSAGCYGLLYILLEGPSPYAAGLYAAAVEELPFGTVLLHLFLDDEEILRCKQTAGVADGSDADHLFSVYPDSE